MDDRINPFASPASDLAPAHAVPRAAPAGPRVSVWQRGSLLMVAKDAECSERCVKCNAPASLRLQRTYYWHHPGVYFSVLLGVLIYVILAMVLRKSLTFAFGLCPECAAKRARDMWIGAFAILAAVGVFVLGVVLAGRQDGAVLLFPASLLVFLFGAVWANSAYYVLAPTEIDEHVGRLKKAGAPFLDSLPRWDESWR